MNQLKFENYFLNLLGVFSFVLVAFPKLSSICLLILGVSISVGHAKKWVKFAWNPLAIALIALYGIYVIGILFGFDKSIGLKYAEYKLGFLILPLLLAIKPFLNFSLKPAIIGLIFGVLVTGVMGITHAFNTAFSLKYSWLCFSNTSLIDTLHCLGSSPKFVKSFLSSEISPVHHPSYFSIFLLFAFHGAFFGYTKKWKGFTLHRLLLFSGFVFLLYIACLSLAGIAFLILWMGFLSLYFLYLKFGKRSVLFILLALPLVFYLVISNVPIIKNEFKEATQSVNHYATNTTSFLQEKAKADYIPGNEIRLIMWTITTELILENPFGVGTGNVDVYLKNRLHKYKLYDLAEKEYNPHNQFLQTTLEIGIIGLFVLLFILVYSAVIAYKNKSVLLTLLWASLAFNSLFESMLQRQSGILFFTFWILVVVQYLNSLSLSKSNT